MNRRKLAAIIILAAGALALQKLKLKQSRVRRVRRFKRWTMNHTVRRKLEPLLLRLTNAERKAKAIELEVQCIRKEITRLITTAKSQSEDDADSSVESTLSSTSSESPAKRFKGDFETVNGCTVVYTDGACENNGKPNAKAGIGVWFGPNHDLNVSKPAIGRATNNTAEIQACIEALEVLKEQNVRRVLIKTDSEFTINCMTKWIQGWKKKNWRLASGGPVKNKTDLEKLDNLRNSFQLVEFEYIKAHVGHEGNEGADQLARDGASRYKSNQT